MLKDRGWTCSTFSALYGRGSEFLSRRHAQQQHQLEYSKRTGYELPDPRIVVMLAPAQQQMIAQGQPSCGAVQGQPVGGGMQQAPGQQGSREFFMEVFVETRHEDVVCICLVSSLLTRRTTYY